MTRFLLEHGEFRRCECRVPSAPRRFQALLLRLLRHRHVEQRIATASIEQIEAWSVRVLSAAMLTEVFAG